MVYQKSGPISDTKNSLAAYQIGIECINITGVKGLLALLRTRFAYFRAHRRIHLNRQGLYSPY